MPRVKIPSIYQKQAPSGAPTSGWSDTSELLQKHDPLLKHVSSQNDTTVIYFYIANEEKKNKVKQK